MRLLGLLPLFFFLAQAVHYWRINELGHLLWMCNIGNLLLAMGLFLEKERVVRLAAIWTIPGLLVWFIYVVLAWGEPVVQAESTKLSGHSFAVLRRS